MSAGDEERVKRLTSFRSPVFQFQRPNFAEFPEDTLADYFADYEEAIHDPKQIVIVSEDIYNPAESESVYEALGRVATNPNVEPTGTIIAGICSLTLKAGSWRIGHFQPDGEYA